MANVMSMLEKLKLVEKMEKEENSTAVTADENNTLEDKYSEELNSEEVEEVDFGNYKPPTKVEETVKEEQPIKVEKNIEPPAKAKNLKNMSIEEIYTANNVETNIMNTVFLLESYINALPQNLPYDIKKTSVINIINATHSDLNRLLGEGESRLKILNSFMNDFQQTLNGGIMEYKNEILKLTKVIDQYKLLIDEKETMLDEQKNVVKFESQKINNIIDFFNNENKH